MIAVDTNLLVYAHRRESVFHPDAHRLVTELAISGSPWAIPWPCVHEFYATVTSPRIFSPATSNVAALGQLSAWMASPTLFLLHESPRHWNTLEFLVSSAKIVGARVHDARIAAICVDHGVGELWSADRDFNRFPRLRVRNPLAV